MPSLWSKLTSPSPSSSSSSSPSLPSTTSTFSSKKNKNPYASPSHPSHPHTSLPAPPSLTVPRTFSSPALTSTSTSTSTAQLQPQQPQQNWNDIPDDMFTSSSSSSSRPKSRRARTEGQIGTRSGPRMRPASPREQTDYLAEAREVLGRDRVTGRLVPSPSPSHHPSQLSPAAEMVRGEGEGQAQGQRDSTSTYQETNQGRLDAGNEASGTKYDLFVREMKARKAGRWRAPEGGFYAPAPSSGTEESR